MDLIIRHELYRDPGRAHALPEGLRDGAPVSAVSPRDGVRRGGVSPSTSLGAGSVEGPLGRDREGGERERVFA